MHLHVEQITGVPVGSRFVADAAWRAEHLPACDAPAAPVVEGLRLELSACRVGENIHLEGEVVAESRLVCSRCLARYPASLRERFALELEPAGSRLPADPEEARRFEREGLHLDDDFRSGWFHGSELHLDMLAAELVMLGLPVQPLCRENCPGLCPMCGNDRSARRCGCAEQPGASPFEALRGLKATLQARAEKQEAAAAAGAVAATVSAHTTPGSGSKAQSADHAHPNTHSTRAAGEVH